jgi:hypothetical protein
VSRPTQVRLGSFLVFAYGAFTLFGRPSQYRFTNQSVSYSTMKRPTTPKTHEAFSVWAFPRSLAATKGISFDFCSSRYLDGSVPWVSLADGYIFTAA